MTDPKAVVEEELKEVEAPADTAGTYHGMSDEDFLKAEAPAEVPSEKAVAETTPDVGDADDPDGGDGDDAGDGGEKPADEAGTDSAKGTAADKPVVPDEGEAKEDKPPVEKKPAADTKAVKPAAGEEKPAETVAVDYEAEYKSLLAPFKANGREMTVANVADARTLMQMGANYNKKMAGLKPAMKLMKLLENNGLLSEEKISLMVEVGNKNPEAIAKLVKDSGLNPMDLDTDKAGEYKPKIHTVDEREIDLDTVLEEIQDTPTYNQTLAIVSQKWDGSSKQVIAAQPQLLRLINDHVESGIYELVSNEIERERTFGRLNGLSDIEAYRQVGDAMNARGAFNHLGSSQKEKPTTKVVVPPKPTKPVDEALKDKRRAASSSKPASPGTPAKDFNPLALSDAEFMKLAAPI